MATHKKKGRQPPNPQNAAEHSKPSKLQAAKHIGSKLLEHEIMTLAGKAIVWVLLNITFLISVLIGVTTYVMQQIEIGANHPILQYAKTHPERVSIAAIAIALATPLIRGLLRALWEALRYVLAWAFSFLANHEEAPPKEEDAPDAIQLVNAFGIASFSPHSNVSERNDDWKNCREKIKGHNAIDLRIMGATGWRTFGDKKAPLYKLLEQFPGEVKILLMKPDPTLPALVQRAMEVGKTPEKYAEEINSTINRLRTLKKDKGRKISLKLYDQMPIWKMVISNDYMWLQHYCKHTDVENTPVYTFFSDGDDGTSLFHALYSVWLKRWEIDGNESFDLTSP